MFQLRLLFDSVTEAQGWRIKGWFKPGVTEQEIVAETYSLHISYLMPASSLTAEQMKMRPGWDYGTFYQLFNQLLSSDGTSV